MFKKGTKDEGDPLKCSFETDTCNWIPDPLYPLSFQRKQANSTNTGTGPFIDNTNLSETGWYMSVGKFSAI